MKIRTKQIELSRGQVAIVDHDFEIPLNHKGEPSKYWVVAVPLKHGPKYYAVRKIKENGVWKTLRLHHDVWIYYRGDLPQLSASGFQMDHIDGDSLNNVISNLRIVTQEVNMHNREFRGKKTSKFRGVCLTIVSNGKYRYWQAKVVLNKKSHAKYFPHTESGEIEAAKHYDKMVREIYGDAARTNF